MFSRNACLASGGTRPSQRRTTLCPTCSLSPNFGGNGFENRNQRPPKLVLPGQDGPVKRSSGSLILPGGGNEGPARSPEGPPPTQPGGFTNFRPPPGFMDTTDTQTNTQENVSVDDMLRDLQSGKGYWHQLAAYLPKLQREGIDGAIIEEMAGIDRRTQNMWINSSMVYLSLKKSGKVPDLEYFDQQGGESLLHELRFLSVNQRIVTANYIASNELNSSESVILARSVKEHERRKGENEGFSDSPADCLAYKYYRDAIENKKEEDVEQYIKKGLEVAETTSAREALESLLGKSSAAEKRDPKKVAKLEVVRLMKDEVGYRPIPLVGNLGSLKEDVVRKAPKVSSTGVFSKFTMPEEGVNLDWMPLPSWSALTLSRHPVAIEVSNCAELYALRLTTGVETEKDILKLQGEALIVMDIKADTSDEESYYVALKKDGKTYDMLELKDIEDVSSILGKVVLVCRPPSRDSIIFDEM